jgi:hypothetical protein
MLASAHQTTLASHCSALLPKPFILTAWTIVSSIGKKARNTILVPRPVSPTLQRSHPSKCYSCKPRWVKAMFSQGFCFRQRLAEEARSDGKSMLSRPTGACFLVSFKPLHYLLTGPYMHRWI